MAAAIGMPPAATNSLVEHVVRPMPDPRFAPPHLDDIPAYPPRPVQRHQAQQLPPPSPLPERGSQRQGGVTITCTSSVAAQVVDVPVRPPRPHATSARSPP